MAASQPATTVPEVIVTAASPAPSAAAAAAAAGEQSGIAVASPPPPPAAQHGHYSKRPRGDDDAPAPEQPRPAPMAYDWPPAIALHCLTNQPAVVDCPFCGSRVQTEVEDNDSQMTILSGIGFGFLCPCIACLPCCLGWFQDVDHYCPCCQQRIAHVPYNLPAQVIVPAPGMMLVPIAALSDPRHQQQQHQQYATGHGYPPMQPAPAQQPQEPPQLARYA